MITTFQKSLIPYISHQAEIRIPSSLERIGSEAFAECYELRSINIPDSIIVIGNDAFESTEIKTVNLPASLQCIDGNPFTSCDELDAITVSPKSVHFAVEDDALYSLQDQRLICSPY